MSDTEMINASAPKTKQLTTTGDSQNATFSFYNEDHTLGNLLRNQIAKNKQVDFCAYSVPHPSEPICNIRVQVSEEAPSDSDANQALKHGLKRISKMCDALTEKFENSLTAYKETHGMSD